MTHVHQEHDDFAVEPIPGLPETPPEGEKILWQGAPSVWALSRDALNLYWVAGYFVALAAWRGIVLPQGWHRNHCDGPAGRYAAQLPHLLAPCAPVENGAHPTGPALHSQH